jgi:pimeloyl-ACP methyl ester carboxylesterase
MKGAEAMALRPAEPSAYSALPSESQIPHLASLIESWNALPARTHLIPTVENGVTVRLALHERGSGRRDRVLVLIHGVLADHQTWRYLGGALGQEYDLWLIDLPGCGESDKPDAETLGPDGYSPRAMASRVMQAVQTRLEASDTPPRLLVVGHSLSGMTALRAFADQEISARHARVIQQVDGLVLLSPSDVMIHQEIPLFVRVIELRSWETAIGQSLGVLAPMIAQGSIENTSYPEFVTREEVDRFIAILTNGDTRRAAQAMLRQAVPWNEKAHLPNWAEMKRIEQGYRHVQVPCQILWGKFDQTLPVSMGYKLAWQLPNGRLTVLPDCMHSAQIECPLDCARLIREFDRKLASSADEFEFLFADHSEPRIVELDRVNEGLMSRLAGFEQMPTLPARKPVHAQKK